MTGAEISKWVNEIAPEHALNSFRENLDADFAYEIAGYSRYRVNVFRDQRGVGIVVRGIPCEIRSTEELGLPPAVEELCELDQGLVLVTGATGSGKSTTLASMIDFINRTRPVHIITIEDPVEFVHIPQKSLINQRELHVDTRSFANALRAALREDPDVVLLGELRDRETIETALEVADTGHLVFGTLHTRSAVNTVARIIEQFEGSRQSQVRGSLAESLRGVISQTLCKAKDGGRVAAFEVLLGNPAVANLIREGKTYQLMSILQTSRGTGMRALNDDLMRLVTEDIIEHDEALKRSNNKTDFENMRRRLLSKPPK
jgi:twitching motility protein PilT